MKDFAVENPKLIYTALGGIVIFILKTYVLKEAFTPELESWLNVILPTFFLFLIGRFTRITKSEAKVLERIEDNKNQIIKGG